MQELLTVRDRLRGRDVGPGAACDVVLADPSVGSIKGPSSYDDMAQSAFTGLKEKTARRTVDVCDIQRAFGWAQDRFMCLSSVMMVRTD